MKKYQLLAILAGGLLTLTCNAATTDNAIAGATTETAPVVAQADSMPTAPVVRHVKKAKKPIRQRTRKARKIRRNKK